MPNPYSDEFRAQAYIALKAAGYPKRGSLNEVSAMLNVPKHTLRRWAERRPVPRIKQTQIDLQTVMVGEIHRILTHLPDKRNQATYRELTATLTALVNGVRGFDSIPPELLECGPLLHEIVSRIKELGWSTRNFFDDMEDELAKEVAKRASISKHKASISPVDDHS